MTSFIWELLSQWICYQICQTRSYGIYLKVKKDLMILPINYVQQTSEKYFDNYHEFGYKKFYTKIQLKMIIVLQISLLADPRNCIGQANIFINIIQAYGYDRDKNYKKVTWKSKFLYYLILLIVSNQQKNNDSISWCTSLFGTQQYLICQTYIEGTYTNIAFQLGQIVAAAFCTYKLQNYSKKGMPINFDLHIKVTISYGFWSLVFEILFFDEIPITLLLLINFFIGAGFCGLYSVLLESLIEKHFLQATAYNIDPIANSYTQQYQIQNLGCFNCNYDDINYSQTFRIRILNSCYLMIIPFCYISIFYKTTFKRFEFKA